MHKHAEYKFNDFDQTADSRKKDHIELAFRSQITTALQDKRFFYEPLLSAHKAEKSNAIDFLNKPLKAPMWISSMTGGTAIANTINKNLALAAHNFGLGMGLGSCRSLLSDDKYFEDFNLRPIIGHNLPLYANLGIAQIEALLENKEAYRIEKLIDKLQADGLIIHVNPIQEWLQPEGDKFKKPALQTIIDLMTTLPKLKYIVKEVGQGMGPQSLEALLRLPLEAIDFAAHGGTNFAKIELLRQDNNIPVGYDLIPTIGHSAEEMIYFTNEIVEKLQKQNSLSCKQIIVSGGISSFLDGYFLINKLSLPSIYGQASAFLANAQKSYEELEAFVHSQIKGLEFANAFLKVR